MHKLILAIALAAAPAAASAITLDFDGAPAPFLFTDARPLVSQYADLGIQFGGHGAVLDDSVADFGLTGLSTPNLLGYANTQQFKGSTRISATSDTIRFSQAQSNVSFNVGSGFSPLMLMVDTFDAGGAMLGSQSVLLGSALQTVTLGGGFSSLTMTLVGARESDVFALDDLTFDQGPAILPAPEPAAFALFGFGVLGVTLARRGRARG